jgi:uncharacterized protein YndB with AHSA1/START domain
MTTTDRTSQQKAQDLVITRIFDAPRELVWKAWTEPEQVMRWWGAKIITSPACKIDSRVGGKYHFCMRMPDGQDVWSTGVYKEIVPLERIVKTDSFADAEGNVVPGSYYGLEEDFPLELRDYYLRRPDGNEDDLAASRSSDRRVGELTGRVERIRQAGRKPEMSRSAQSPRISTFYNRIMINTPSERGLEWQM